MNVVVKIFETRKFVWCYRQKTLDLAKIRDSALRRVSPPGRSQQRWAVRQPGRGLAVTPLRTEASQPGSD